MKAMKILLSILITSNICFADDSVVPLKKDQPAPFDGVLFNNQKANQIKVDLNDKDIYKDLSLSYEKTIKLYKDKDDLSNQQIRELLDTNKKLSDSLGNDKLNDIVWFSLGVLATGLSIYAAKKTLE